MPHKASSSSRPAKRRRTQQVVSFGAPSDADSPTAQVNVPSSTGLSTREVPDAQVPPLTVLCARVFAIHFARLSRSRMFWEPRNPKQWHYISEWLKALPDSIVPRLFATLRQRCPQLLSHELVKEHFLRGESIMLSPDLGGEKPVNKYTVGAIVDCAPNVQNLDLLGFDKILDASFAAIVSRLRALRVLTLRGCTKVGARTVEAASKHCPDLVVLNINYTSVPPVALAPLLNTHRASLEVLKLAGLPNWTDAAFAKLLHALPDKDTFQLPSLRTLKLRESSLSDGSVHAFLSFCPHLARLDLSFTGVRHPPAVIPPLEKLALTSTAISAHELLLVVENLPHLHTLNLGALGSGQGKASAIGNTTAMTMNDDFLRSLTDILAMREQLHTVNLVGNTKLGLGNKLRDPALAGFVSRVGRRLKRLNLAGITALQSSDLKGLSGDALSDGPVSEEDTRALEDLNLNNTKVDDGAAEYIARCTSLRSLEVAGTKMSSDGLFTIVDACPRLAKLDLTSCRGVPVVERRRFFEVYENVRRELQ